ncbi:MAG: MipA/OmpV family protein [Gammaproteobacteria bacterium]|nr:MipA/OmpV family protein [Gammaproteobacteria bacterium]
MGFSGISFPDYLGSMNGTQLNALSLFRLSQRLEVDREGVTEELFESPDGNWISASAARWRCAATTTNSAKACRSRSHTRTRPRVTLRNPPLVRQQRSFPAGLPIRTAIASDFTHIRDVGWLSNPNIRYERDRFGGDGTWNVDASFGAVFGNERYHDYFYGVSPGDATALRPAYEAKGGFGGWRLALGFSRRVGDFWYGGFIRYYDLSDAVYIDSPLVETESAWAGGFAMAWIFADSGKKDE